MGRKAAKELLHIDGWLDRSAVFVEHSHLVIVPQDGPNGLRVRMASARHCVQTS